MDDFRLVKAFEDRPQLEPFAAGIAQYLSGRRSIKTALSIQERFEAFMTWAEQVGLEEGRLVLNLPAKPEDVVRFASSLDSRGMALSSIRSYVSAIGTVHRALGLHNPTSLPVVKDFIAHLSSKHADTRRRQARALTEKEIDLVLRNLDHPRRMRGGGMERGEITSWRAGVDRALLLAMIQAGLRRTEAANLRWGDVRRHPDATGRLVIRSNTGNRREELVAVTRTCFRALVRIKPDYVDDEASVFSLSDSQIVRRLKTMCDEAGIDFTEVSGNTPRATLLSIMAANGAPIEMVQRQMRLNSPAIVARYVRQPDAGEPLKWL